MDRLGPRGRFAVSLCLAAALAGVAAGCNAVAGMWWVIKDGKTQPAEYKGLNGKKVAVVVRSPNASMFRQQANIPYQLTRAVNRLLKENLGKKTQIVPVEKVDKATDKKGSTDFTEIGQQVDADQVVAIELEDLKLNLSTTIYLASVSVSVSVYDLEHDGEVVYGPKTMANIQYPPTSLGQEASAMKPNQFIEMFVAHLANRIALRFYDSDPRADFADWGVPD